MNILFDNEQLIRLLTNLYTLTGIQSNIFDLTGKDITISGEHKDFCRLINACPEGHTRCESCDAQAVSECAKTQKFYSYRCHAGLCENIFPIFSDGVPVAYLVFGQLLSENPVEEQWQKTAATLDWYQGDIEELRAAFFRLKQYSEQEITAHAEIMEALAHYIQLKGMIRATEHNDLQRLEAYLDEHYMEKLSLASISSQLHIGRTKLCALAKNLSNGQTLTYIITERRINAAKKMLLQSNTPISAIAEAVGISDYNYFSKVFRSMTGTTPSAFRKEHRHSDGIRRKIVE